MTPEAANAAGVTPAGTGIDGIVWNVLGQAYVPLQVSDASFAWHATFPSETFVPPHIHDTQDEFIRVLDGTLDLVLDGQQMTAGTGDLVRMPRGLAHGLFNTSGETLTALFWATPTGHLFDLFKAIHNVADPREVVRISAEHEVRFMKPVKA